MADFEDTFEEMLKEKIVLGTELTRARARVTELIAFQEKDTEALIKCGRRVDELIAERDELRHKLDKYNIPDAEVDKLLAALPDLKAEAAAADGEIKNSLLKVDLTVESFAANLKTARADLDTNRVLMGALYRATEPIAIADEHDVVSEDGYTTINENTRKAIVEARAAIYKEVVKCPPKP